MALLAATILFTSALIVSAQSIGPPSDHSCRCIPQQFNGRLSFPDEDACRTRPFIDDFQQLSFAVDYVRGKLFATQTGPNTNLDFIVQLDPSGKALMYMFDRMENDCWAMSSSSHKVDRCLFDDNSYLGHIRNGDQTGFVYALKHQNPTPGGNQHLIVSSGTCLPMGETVNISLEDMTDDNITRFDGMAVGLGPLRRLVNFPVKGLTCRRDRHLLGRNELTWLKVRHLIEIFFTPETPQPCCGQLQWEAYLTLTTNYAVSGGMAGQNVVQVPRIFVDYLEKQVSGTMIQKVYGQPAENVTFLIEYGESQNMTIYLVNRGVECTYMQIVSTSATMMMPCIPEEAIYKDQVYVGTEALDSVTLNIWQIDKFIHPIFNMTSDVYVTERNCMVQTVNYVFETPFTIGSGTAAFYNIRSSKIDPRSVQSIKQICVGVPPKIVSQTQIKTIIDLVLGATRP